MEKHYFGHRKRLKDKFFKNPVSLEDYEILELLLGYVIRGKDTKPLAKEILKKAKGVKNIFELDAKNVKGLGKETEIFFKLIREFYLRVNRENVIESNEQILNSPEKVFDFLKFFIGFQEKEHFVAILLNSSGKVIDCKTISTGTINQAAVFVREVAEIALLHSAVSVIVAHNHPSGLLTFSENDYIVTKKIKDGLNSLEIILQDHILVTKNGYLSMRQEDKVGFWR
jgi:DNA repair protein RadC